MLQKVLRRRDLTGPELDLRRKPAKQAGVHWSVSGAASILALRTQHASGRWNDFIAPEHTPPARLRTAV
jgi:hypothetical protein